MNVSNQRYKRISFASDKLLLDLRILTIMNPHSYHREHLLYSRIGLGVFLR